MCVRAARTSEFLWQPFNDDRVSIHKDSLVFHKAFLLFSLAQSAIPDLNTVIF